MFFYCVSYHVFNRWGGDVFGLRLAIWMHAGFYIDGEVIFFTFGCWGYGWSVGYISLGVC